MYILRLAEAISSLQEVRQELEKKLQRIQHLRRSCEGTREKKMRVLQKKQNVTHSTSARKLCRQESARFDYVYVFVRHQTWSVYVAHLSIEHVSSAYVQHTSAYVAHLSIEHVSSAYVQHTSAYVAYLSAEHVSSVGVGSSETQARSTL